MLKTLRSETLENRFFVSKFSSPKRYISVFLFVISLEYSNSAVCVYRIATYRQSLENDTLCDCRPLQWHWFALSTYTFCLILNLSLSVKGKKHEKRNEKHVWRLVSCVKPKSTKANNDR